MAQFIQRHAKRLSPKLLELRAGHIQDPIERLRFLRQAGGLIRPPRRRRWWAGVWLVPLTLVLLTQTPRISDATVHRGVAPRVVRPAGPAPAPSEFPRVWLVESRPDYELYSNGLRVEKDSEASGRPRSYQLRSAEGKLDPTVYTTPAGIVYHATESPQAPFEADSNRRLKQIGEALLDYVQRRGAYNFVVDRFGRVHRIVPEGQVSNHAGNSVWADARGVYIGLNASFLGVSFEAQTSEGGGQGISAAQIHAGRILTEMLRGKYRIPAGNCVTHGQVSVNPGNMRIGYHTDWSEDFPFAAMGLGNNYSVPLPAIYLFGFGYDENGPAMHNAALREALAVSEDRLREAAAANGHALAAYRRVLKRTYQALAHASAPVVEGVNR